MAMGVSPTRPRQVATPPGHPAYGQAGFAGREEARPAGGTSGAVLGRAQLHVATATMGCCVTTL
jgi:hypothetical protein